MLVKEVRHPVNGDRFETRVAEDYLIEVDGGGSFLKAALTSRLSISRSCGTYSRNSKTSCSAAFSH